MIKRYASDGRLVLWLCLAGALALEHVLVVIGEGPSPWWWLLIMLGAVTVAVAAARTRAHLALGVVTAAIVARLVWSAAQETPFPVSFALVLVVMGWLAGRRAKDARAITLVVVSGNVALLVLSISLRGSTDIPTVVLSWLVAVLWSLAFVVLPWLLGRHRQQQVQLALAGWERAERAEHEQQLLVEQARLRERALIARDMHDSVGHELSLIALRAGGLEMATDLTEQHRRAAGELRVAAATATAHLAEAIGVLREDASPAPLTPADEAIPDLVARAAASGMQVDLVTDGALAQAPVVVRLAAQRVVREGLTNAAKHASGSAVSVRVDSEQDRTTVSVANGAGTGTAVTQHPGGYGLRGLGELVDLLGGSLRAHHRPEGGHELTVEIPHTKGAGRPHEEPRLPESRAQEWASAGRRARRGWRITVVAPLVMGLTLGVVTLGYYVGISYASILDPSDYAELRPGDSRTSVEARLPPLQMVDPPLDRGAPAPAGATCAHYRPGGPFTITFAYRLCFAGDTLVSKDVIQTGSVPPDEENP